LEITIDCLGGLMMPIKIGCPIKWVRMNNKPKTRKVSSTM
jgi:hypothetical protein